MSLNRKKGFTLLEIMVALLVFAILAMAISVGLRQVLEDKAITDSQQEQLAKLQMTILLMRRDIAQVIYRPVKNSSGLIRDFLGTSNYLFFVRTGFINPVSKEKRSELKVVEYNIRENQLLRSTSSVLDYWDVSEFSGRVLYDQVEKIPTQPFFRYLDRENQWQDAWPPLDNPKAGLPKAVQVAFHVPEWGNVTQFFLIAGSSPHEKKS